MIALYIGADSFTSQWQTKVYKARAAVQPAPTAAVLTAAGTREASSNRPHQGPHYQPQRGNQQARQE